MQPTLPPIRAQVVYSLLQEDREWVLRRTGRRESPPNTVEAGRTDKLTPGALPPAFEDAAEAVRSGKAIVVSAVPAQQSLCRFITAPFADQKKASRVFPGLLELQLPFSVAASVHDFTAVSCGDSGTRALAIACKAEPLEADCESMLSAGLPPARIDHEGLSAWEQACAEGLLRPDHLTVLLLIRRQQTLLCAGTPEEFIGCACVASGSNDLLSTDPAGARRWASAVNPSILAWQSRTGRPWAAAAGFCGRAFSLTALRATLATQPGQTGPEIIQIEEPDSFVARGVVYRALKPGDWACNLLPPAIAAALTGKAGNRAASRISLVALIIALLAFALAATHGILLAISKHNIEEDIASLATSTSGLANVPYGQEQLVVERERDTRRETMRPFLEAFENRQTTFLRELLFYARDHGIFLEELHMAAGQLSLRGAVEDWDACEPFSAMLTNLGYDVALKRDPAGADEMVHFTLEGGRRR